MGRRRKKTWTCSRVSNKVRCGTVNDIRCRKCRACEKPKPPRQKKKHEAALDLSYEHYIEINGGEHCGICGALRKPGGIRLHRDHVHSGEYMGLDRGLLCFRCNSALRPYMTSQWLRLATYYVEKAQARKTKEREAA